MVKSCEKIGGTTQKSPCKMFRHVYNTRTGDMAELVECARLEIVYTGNCIEGSNPPISARNLPRHGAGEIYGGHRVREMDAPLSVQPPIFQ